MKKPALLLLLLPLLAACSSLTTHEEPQAGLGRLQHVFVERRLAGGRGIDEIITRELQNLGYDASSGPLTMMPPDTQAIISYEDQWTWDFTRYMIELDVSVRDAQTGRALASARYFHPLTAGKLSPAEMVQKVLPKLFPRRAAAAAGT